jgi:hypothetical protein
MNEMILLDEDGQDQAHQPDRSDFDVAVRNQGVTKRNAKIKNLYSLLCIFNLT